MKLIVDDLKDTCVNLYGESEANAFDSIVDFKIWLASTVECLDDLYEEAQNYCNSDNLYALGDIIRLLNYVSIEDGKITNNDNYVIQGDYVIQGVSNAFNNKMSFWISKKDYDVSYYCFSVDRNMSKWDIIKETVEQFGNIGDYVEMFESRITKEEN